MSDRCFDDIEIAQIREHYAALGAVGMIKAELLRPIWTEEAVRTRARRMGVKYAGPKQRSDGIHDLAGLRMRCTVNECGCWVYTGAYGVAATRCGVYLPAGVAGDKPRVMTAQRAAVLLSGRRLKRGQCVLRKLGDCRVTQCCNPDHQTVVARSEVTRLTMWYEHVVKSPRRAAAYEALRMAKCISVDLVRQAEQLRDAGLHCGQAALQIGISETTVRRIYAGRHVLQVRPTSSVFTMGRCA